MFILLQSCSCCGFAILHRSRIPSSFVQSTEQCAARGFLLQACWEKVAASQVLLAPADMAARVGGDLQTRVMTRARFSSLRERRVCDNQCWRGQRQGKSGKASSQSKTSVGGHHGGHYLGGREGTTCPRCTVRLASSEDRTTTQKFVVSVGSPSPKKKQTRLLDYRNALRSRSRNLHVRPVR